MSDKPNPTIARIPLKPLGPDATPYEKNLAEMQECATAIGNLCCAWSGLEHVIDKLLIPLMAIDERERCETVLANINLQQKLKMAAHLGYLRRLSEEWFTTLKWCLDQTQSDLRERRNVAVHGRWEVKPTGITLIHPKSHFVRDPGTGERSFYTSKVQTVTKDTIWQLTKDVQHMLIRLDILRRAGQVHEDWKKSLEEQGLLPPRAQG